ncbi:hypothetical protein MINTM018_52390 (plasmid) [Mycobacterium intracellulare]|uniref:Uncharacterized protein n=1 Tax=Mycobacterium intracellulare TaxID=1767 RepID=A0A7R7RQB4_MYCIT|nr:hypothetical protein MINTM018_52390 [Mycobacterium intracellulare]
MTSNDEGAGPEGPSSLRDLVKPIKKAAKIVASQWPGVIDADDVEQEIWLYLVESPGSAHKALEAIEPKAQARFLTRIGHQRASKARAAYAYFRGAYKYSVKDVKDLLASGGLSADNQDRVKVEYTDLHEAFRKLKDRNESYSNAIAKRYLLSESMGSSREQDALKNGVIALTDEMNRSNRNNRYS